ncbi:MAG TPA: sugar phosphate isomerase/epimerase family protein [Lacipirellulaceae bacterium]|nr:sugar phosphate isomerase/epimerase family protein [Lacipirellulaceae bacterium]
MVKLAAFPKAYIDQLCVDGSMTIRQWIELAATLNIDGLEFYTGFLELAAPRAWRESRAVAADHGLVIPMLCCSPDFTHPDPTFRRQQVDLQKHWIDMAAAFGGTYCRVLSGQRRSGLAPEAGLKYAAECISACLDHAAGCGITLVLENHYKDNYWDHPEFAQSTAMFCELVSRIDSPHFGVNYDPSNAYLAGEDPLELLELVKHRVVTMHASDRYLIEGTLEDLRQEEDSRGYAARLRHGVIGQGLNDYDAIFSVLRDVGFDNWISIEDGIDGIEQLRESVRFLRMRIAEFWSRG